MKKNETPEVSMYKWWSKIRWFIILVMFAIGILRVGQIHQAFPVMIFMITFAGMAVLNFLFQLQIISTNNIFGTIQILFDIIFATMVVHLTGGVESSFVWIYLLAVITAGIGIEKAGGFIAAMIGSFCLLLLVLAYNFGWLTQVDGRSFNADIATQTIFLISYTGLFSGMAFIASFVGETIKKFSHTTINGNEGKDLGNTEDKTGENIEPEFKEKLDSYKNLLDIATSMSSMDHDINNHLTVISLSTRRVKKAADDYNDEKLLKSSVQMTEALKRIQTVLGEFEKLKHQELVAQERIKRQG